MHNYFVSFTYIHGDSKNRTRCYDNCIMVDTTDTATSTASQLDDLIKRFTNQIEQQLDYVEHVVILNVTRMN